MANEQLLAALANNQDQIQPDPFYTSGQNILKMQLPQATNDTEAIVGPLVRGLLGGVLSGYGQQEQNQQAFTQEQQNPIMQALANNPIIPSAGPGSLGDIGPVASGDIYGADISAGKYAPNATMPSDWTPTVGKGDLLSALITKQKLDEEEVKKQALRDEVTKSTLAEYVKQGGDPTAAITAINSGNFSSLAGSDTTTTESPRMKALLDAYGITDPTVRAGIKTPDEADKYLTHIAGQADKKATGDTKRVDQLNKQWETTNSKVLDVLAPVKMAASTLANTDTPISDLMYAETVQRLMTPGAQVIRDGVLSKIQNAASPYQRLAGKVNTFFGGGPLSDETKKQFMQIISDVADEKLNYYKSKADDIKNLGAKTGLNPDTLIPSYDTYFSSLKPSASTQIPTGAIATGQTSGGKPVYNVGGKLWIPD